MVLAHQLQPQRIVHPQRGQNFCRARGVVFDECVLLRIQPLSLHVQLGLPGQQRNIACQAGAGQGQTGVFIQPHFSGRDFRENAAQ